MHIEYEDSLNTNRCSIYICSGGPIKGTDGTNWCSHNYPVQAGKPVRGTGNSCAHCSSHIQKMAAVVSNRSRGHGKDTPVLAASAIVQEGGLMFCSSVALQRASQQGVTSPVPRAMPQQLPPLR
eukprot:gene57357-biopygen24332